MRTNWSWFIHPWKKQIDFIIGKHVVLNEPINKNIFEESIVNVYESKAAAAITRNLSLANASTIVNTYNDSSNSNLSSSNVSSKNAATSLLKSSFNDMASYEDKEKTNFIKHVEKDIIDYISRVSFFYPFLFLILFKFSK